MGFGAAADGAAPATGAPCSAAEASATVGIFSVVPATTAESSVSPLAAASARVVKLLAAAIPHSVSPDWTTCGTEPAAGVTARTKNVSEIRTVRMARNRPRPGAPGQPSAHDYVVLQATSQRADRPRAA